MGIADAINTQRTIDFGDTYVIGIDTNIVGYSVRDSGAAGDGVTNDYVSIYQASQIASQKGVALFFPPGTYSYSTPITFVVPTVFAPGAVLAPTGTTATTFLGPIDAPPVRIFSATMAASLATIIGNQTPYIFAEWFGAIGDGVTNDTIAVQAALASPPLPNSGVNGQPGNSGGTIQLLARTYLINGLTIYRGNISLRGMGWNKTVLRCTGANSSALNVGNGPQIWYIDLRDFAIDNQLSLAIGTGSIGLYINGAQQSNFENLYILNRATGVYCTNTGGAYFRNVQVIVSYAPTATTIVGWNIDGTNPNASLTCDNCVANFPALVSGNVPIGGYTSYGFYLHGATIKDSFFRGCQPNNCGIGFNIDGTGGTSALDLHILDAIVDSFFVQAFYLNSLGPTSTLEITGGWSNPVTIGATAFNLYALNSHGVSIVGHTFFAGPNFANQRGVYLSACQDFTITGCVFKNFLYGIYFSASGICVANGNTFYNLTGQTAAAAIYADATAYRLGIIGNVINGQAAATVGTGILLAAGCDYCNVVGNTINAGAATTTVNVNAGTNTHTYFAGVTT